MKKLLLGLLVLGSLSVMAQTIDTTITGCTAARINEVYFRQGFPEQKDTLSAIGITGSNQSYSSENDTLVTVSYVLIANDGRRVKSNQYTLTSAQYTAWDGSALMLLQFVAAFLKLTFK